MTYLRFTTETQEVFDRVETDPEVIAKFIQLGWVEVDPPEAPQPSEEETKEATFRATIATGHCVIPEGYCLAMDDQDRANWSQLLVLLREAESLGAINGSSPVQFLDITGTLQTAPLTRFREIIVSLGQAYQNAFFARHS